MMNCDLKKGGGDGTIVHNSFNKLKLNCYMWFRTIHINKSSLKIPIKFQVTFNYTKNYLTRFKIFEGKIPTKYCILQTLQIIEDFL